MMTLLRNGICVLPEAFLAPTVHRGGAATPPRNSCTTTPSRRGGGANHSGWVRLVPTSLSPACQRRISAADEKSAILPESSASAPSWTSRRIVIVAPLPSARHL